MKVLPLVTFQWLVLIEMPCGPALFHRRTLLERNWPVDEEKVVQQALEERTGSITHQEDERRISSLVTMQGMN
jgi:hypothetical protein